MRRLKSAVLLSAMAFTPAALLPGVSRAAANPAPQSQAEKSEPAPLQVYGVQYNIYEVANEKRTNSRTYRTMVAIIPQGETSLRGSGLIRVGNRIPINLGSSLSSQPNGDKMPIYEAPIQYNDVGMEIDCSVLDTPAPAGRVLLDTTIKWSSVTGKDVATGNPLMRNFQFKGFALVPFEKPTVIGAVDDVTSDHQYQIEVTVKKVE